MTYSTKRPSQLRQIMLSGMAAAALFATTAGAAYAQADRGEMQGGGEHGEHQGWGQERGASYAYRRGERMGYNDWNNAPVVDYRAQHLRHPHRGYEWREHNGRYVLVAAATGLIASVVSADQR
jgi:Ni/Co efflux regulator RcnB